MLEALKCLCNMIFNSTCAQALCAKNHSIEGIVIRLRTYRDPELPHEIKVFDMKMLFVITALCAEVRPVLKNELHGLTYLMETLDLILKEAAGDERGATCSDMPITLSVSACLYVGCNFNFGNNAMQAKPDGVNCCNFCHVLRCV